MQVPYRLSRGEKGLDIVLLTLIRLSLGQKGCQSANEVGHSVPAIQLRAIAPLLRLVPNFQLEACFDFKGYHFKGFVLEVGDLRNEFFWIDI